MLALVSTTTTRRTAATAAISSTTMMTARTNTTAFWQVARYATAAVNHPSSSSSSFFSTAAAITTPTGCSDDEEAAEAQILLILGKPGGGKGTISGKILQDFPRFCHVSTGDLLRQHVRKQTELGLQAKAFMDAGALVPDNLMIDLVLDESARVSTEAGIRSMGSGPALTTMTTTTSTSSSSSVPLLLLDGFPRNLPQTKALESVTSIDYVVNLNVPTETIVERIADRWIHPASGRVYSYSYKPPQREGVDDVTGEPLIQRDDDQPQAVRTRLEAYDKVTLPLVEYYKEQGVLQTFSGTESDVLYPQVKEWLQQQGF